MGTSAEKPKLSAAARRSLEARLRTLEDERIPDLEGKFVQSGDPMIEAALRETIREVDVVRHILATATPLEDEPHDPAVIELGDTVTVRESGSSEREQFILAGDLEARLDESWISVRSPMGSALLGSRKGEFVNVKAPGGTVSYEILAIARR